MNIQTIGVVGLGLIGGSLAKALKQNKQYQVYGFDVNQATLRKAILVGAIDDVLTEERLPQSDLVIIALYPQDTIHYIQRNASLFKKGSLVMDCSGVKRFVCESAAAVAAENGFTFIGGHPMAGLEHSGFAYSQHALFQNASMILVPTKGTPIELVQAVKQLFLGIGFTNMPISSPEEHDEIIAFSSQLAHVVSSAYIKSPVALEHKGFSAGSYKDLTRVAKLNEEMWTELFLANPDYLVSEIDGLIQRLGEYGKAIQNRDGETLKRLLREGRERKALIDKDYF